MINTLTATQLVDKHYAISDAGEGVFKFTPNITHLMVGVGQLKLDVKEMEAEDLAKARSLFIEKFQETINSL